MAQGICLLALMVAHALGAGGLDAECVDFDAPGLLSACAYPRALLSPRAIIVPGDSDTLIPANDALDDPVTHRIRTAPSHGLPYRSMTAPLRVLPRSTFEALWQDTTATAAFIPGSVQRNRFPPPPPPDSTVYLAPAPGPHVYLGFDLHPGNGNPFHWAETVAPLFTLRRLCAQGALPSAFALAAWGPRACAGHVASAADASAASLAGATVGAEDVAAAVERLASDEGLVSGEGPCAGPCGPRPIAGLREEALAPLGTVLLPGRDGPASDWQRAFLGASTGAAPALGTAWTARRPLIAVSRLVIPGTDLTVLPSPAAAAHFRRSLHAWLDLPPPAAVAPRTIALLVRGPGATRRLANRGAVEAALAAEAARAGLHFKVHVFTDSSPMREQAAALAQAAVLVGVHGAGLTGTVLLSERAGVVELTHPLMDYSLYSGIAAATGHRHTTVLGRTEAPVPKAFANATLSQCFRSGPCLGWAKSQAVRVDPAEVAARVRQLLSGAGL